MNPSSSGPEQRRWRTLGCTDPYWAVCTEERYRSGRLSDADREVFFESGRLEVRRTFQLIERHIQAGFQPVHALDFGCGVGRLTIPLALDSQHATGVDISETMLAEARRNADSQGVGNIRFQLTEEFLSSTTPDLDFVHSYIVFQHIHPRDGMGITRALLQRLKPGGIGALHYTYARRATVLRRVVHALRRHLLPLNIAINIARGRHALEPMIPVFEYDLHDLFAAFTWQHCSPVHTILTNHGNHLGAMFLFRKAVPPG